MRTLSTCVTLSLAFSALHFVAATPDATPDDQPAAEALDPAKQAAYQKNVAAVRGHLRSRKLNDAQRELKQAEANAQSDEQFKEVHRLGQIHHNLTLFWETIFKALPTLNGDFAVGKTRVMIVEATRQGMTIKDAGQIKRYDYANMPGKLVAALATERFAMDANWQYLLGTFLAVDGDGDQGRARQLWAQAKKGGMKVDELLPEIGGGKAEPASGGGPAASGEDFAKQLAELSKRAKDARTQAAHSEVAQAGLKLTQEAAATQKMDIAKQAAELALTAARHSKNVTLMRNANAAVQRLEASRK